MHNYNFSLALIFTFASPQKFYNETALD